MASAGRRRANPSSLEEEYQRLRHDHRAAIKSTVVRMSLPGSIMRVFRKGTKAELMRALESLPVEALPTIVDHEQFLGWFQTQRRVVADAIRRKNSSGVTQRVRSGNDWGHAPKILAVFLHNLVCYSRYFTDAQAQRIEPLLTCPIDGPNLARLRTLGEQAHPSLIRDISSEDQRVIQDRMLEVATVVGVPRVWFDDNWGSRAEPEEH